MRIRTRPVSFIVAALVAVLPACRDPGGPAVSPRGEVQLRGGAQARWQYALPAFPELADTIREVRLPRGTADSPRHLSDAELVEAVRIAGGVVSIGFRPPAAPTTRESGVVPGMSRAAALAARQAVAAQSGVVLLQSYRYSSSVVARIPPELAPRLRRLPFVDFVEPEAAGSVQSVRSGLPASPSLSQDTGWGIWKVGAPWAWLAANQGEGASITILDTGVDSMHVWDYVWGDGPQNLEWCAYVAPIANTCYLGGVSNHGAHVAGVVSARDNQVVTIGVAPWPRHFASVRVTDDLGRTYSGPLTTALDWAISLGWPRHIINFSVLLCEHHTDFAAAVQRALDAGIVIVAAGGNTEKCPGVSGLLYPSRYDSVIAVTGTTESDDSWSGSRYGSQVSLSAPYAAFSMWANGYYGVDAGTSVAAPFVTGVAALVWTAYPYLTADQLRKHLLFNAEDRGPTGWDSQYGYGRVSARLALEQIPPWPPSPPPPPATATITGVTEALPSATCTWHAYITPLAEPLVYEWAVDGQARGGNSPTLTYTVESGSFTVSVWIHDALGRHAFDDHFVAVSWGARECNEQ